MAVAVALIVAYLLGSIPVALIVARRHGVDLFATGDGNPGAWNALDQLGGRRAWPAFIGDGAKGLLAGLLGHALGGIELAYGAVAAAMVGHAFPVFTRGRGGKSVMTFAGGAFAVAPLAALLALALCGAVSAARGFAWGARAGIFAFPLVQLALAPVEHVAATGGLMCLIGARFLVSRSARARSASDAAPTT